MNSFLSRPAGNPTTTACLLAFFAVPLFTMSSIGCGEIESRVDQSRIPETEENSEPDYETWNELLDEYVSPTGIDYERLIENNRETLDDLRLQMASVDVDSLDQDEQLAYWINLYNINVVATILDHYPVESIRDISTDPVRRLNVFESEIVPFQGRLISLDTIEHEHVRELGDARIHFAINCAARSCPPVRGEPFTGREIDEQLDEQTRRFLAGPNGVRAEMEDGTLRLHTTRIMDWFKEDFEEMGGAAEFIEQYGPPEISRRIRNAEEIEVVYDDYSWDLNEPRSG